MFSRRPQASAMVSRIIERIARQTHNKVRRGPMQLSEQQAAELESIMTDVNILEQEAYRNGAEMVHTIIDTDSVTVVAERGTSENFDMTYLILRHPTFKFETRDDGSVSTTILFNESLSEDRNIDD